MSWRYVAQTGFALPTVVIASVVMLMILVTTVGSVSSARVSLDAQFDEQRLRDAAESGAARAQDCIANSTMTLNATVTPATNCDGSVISGRSPYILNGSTFRTSYAISLTSSSPQSKKIAISGKFDALRTSTGVVVKSKTLPLSQNAIMVLDPSGDRPSQRYWYYGTRGILDFGASGSAMPTLRTNNASASPSPDAGEGSTTVSDQNGNVVFWSNGITIWDKTGGVMQNSTGLSGGSSSTQAVASFPLNTSRTKYGVVSNSGQGETGYGELYFTVVDMALNGGNGAVTAKKNVRLGGTGYAGEGLNAMPNADGTGYYVYSYNPVLAKVTYFLIKNDETVAGPYTWTMSPAPPICYQGVGGFAGYGSFNFTQDYSKMIMLSGSWRCDGTGVAPMDTGRAYLFSMNTATGAPTLDASWITGGWGASGGTHGGYTADFSPQEKYVYVGQIYPGAIMRYNITSGDSTTIKNSEWIIGYDTTDTNATHQYQAGAHIRQGPDGRMWIANRNIKWQIANEGLAASTPCKIGYISAPDSPTNSVAGIGFYPDSITMPAGSCSSWGLSQVATVFVPKIVLY
jgi:hypothetical protein